MAVVGSAQIRKGYPKGEFTLTGRKYTVQYIVNVNSRDDGAEVVQSASGLPAFYDSYSIGNDHDPYALLREGHAERLDNADFVWVVECVFSTPTEKEFDHTGTGAGTHQDTAGSYTDPTVELPTAKFGSARKSVPVSRIYNVNTGRFTAPLNSACEVFSPPAMHDKFNLTLTISRNELITAPHPLTNQTYQNTINSDIFWGFAPGYWRCVGILPEQQVKQLQGGTVFKYLKVEYTFEGNSDGHDLLILDAGNYYCPDAPTGSGSGSGSPVCNDSGSGSGLTNCGRKTPFLDDAGHPRRGLLNGRGNRLAGGADPVYLTVRPYNRLPFAALNLPQTFAGVQ